jgi:hypothetical protein
MGYLSNKPGSQITPEESIALSELADLGNPGDFLTVNISGTGLEYTANSFFKLDQSSPQSVTGTPIFVDGINIGDVNTHITKDGSGNLSFEDAVTGLKTLAELVGGGSASSLPDLTDVDDTLAYTLGFVFQADGTKYTGAQLSHTILDDIGGLTHDELDTHVNSDTTAHTLSTNLLHTTGDESKAGLLTFSDTCPKCAVSAEDDDDLPNKLYVDAQAAGLNWTYTPCIDINLSAPPVGPTTGDRYIVNPTGSGDWSGHDNDIATWNGSSWDFVDFAEGLALLETDSGKQWRYIAGSVNDWKQIGQSQTYTADGQGLQLIASEFSLELDGATLSKGASGVKLAAGFGTANQILGMNADGNAHEYKNLTAGSNVTITDTVGGKEISASVSGVADYFYTQITFHSHLSSSYTWTNMPDALTAIAIYRRANLTGAVQYRICAHQAVAGFAGADINLQYSTNGSTWYACDIASAGELDVGTGTGLKTGPWANLAAGALQDVRLRIVGKQGDGIVDPQFRELWVEIKYNASIVDLVSSDTVDKEITVHSHPASNLVWTNMPLALTEFVSTYTRSRADLSNCTHYRIYVSQSVAGFAGADLNMQYSLDGTTWVAADLVSGAGELDVGTGTGLKTGAWAALKDSAKGDVYLRLVGKDGDGAVDPAWRQVKIQFREHTYGTGVTGSDQQVLFNDSGATGADSGLVYNKVEKSLSVLGSVTAGRLESISSGSAGGFYNTAIILLQNSDDISGNRSAILWLPDSLETNHIVLDSDLNIVSGSKWVFAGDLEATDITASGDLTGTNIIADVGTIETINSDIANIDVAYNQYTLGGKIWQKIGSTDTFTDLSPSNKGRASDINGNIFYLGTYHDVGQAQIIIYDITDRLNPTRLSPTTISGLPSGGNKSVKYYDGYLYTTYDSNNTGVFRILDVSDPTTPVVVAGSELDLGAAGGGATLDIDSVNNIVYVATANTVYSIDISDPTTPVILDSISGLQSDGTLWTLKYNNGHVYTAGRAGTIGDTTTLYIIDVSDPEDITIVTPTTPVSLHGTWALFAEGDYLYMANGDSFEADDYNKFAIVDVADPSNPNIVGELFISRSPSSYIRKVGDYCYLANWGTDAEIGQDPSNLFVINVADVENPFIVGKTAIASMPLNLYPVDNGRYLYVAFATFASTPPFWGVVESNGIFAHYVETEVIKIGNTTLNETQLQSLLALL